MSEPLRARVTFKKTANAGDYSNETVEVSIDVELTETTDGDFDELKIAAALATARRLTHDELRASPSWKVRQSTVYDDPHPKVRLGVPPPEPDDDDVEDLPV